MRTIAGYKEFVKLINGPLLIGTKEQRRQHTMKGTLFDGARFDALLGKVRLQDLGTAHIRSCISYFRCKSEADQQTRPRWFSPLRLHSRLRT